VVRIHPMIAEGETKMEVIESLQCQLRTETHTRTDGPRFPEGADIVGYVSNVKVQMQLIRTSPSLINICEHKANPTI